MKLIKRLYDIYCSYIGIHNEGNKRLLAIASFILPIFYIYFYCIIEDVFLSIEDINDKSIFRRDFIGFYIIYFPLWTLITGIIIKLYCWVLDGYKNN